MSDFKSKRFDLEGFKEEAKESSGEINPRTVFNKDIANRIKTDSYLERRNSEPVIGSEIPLHWLDETGEIQYIFASYSII